MNDAPKHTPGPWSINEHGVSNLATIRNKDGTVGKVARWCSGTPDPDGQNSANAHLIAAAPDLLAALEDFVLNLPCPPTPECSCHLVAPCNDCVNHSGDREMLSNARAAISKATGGAA